MISDLEIERNLFSRFVFKFQITSTTYTYFGITLNSGTDLEVDGVVSVHSMTGNLCSKPRVLKINKAFLNPKTF